MPETFPQQSPEEREVVDPANLNFNELSAAYELAHTTFRVTEDGFESIDGDKIVVREVNGVYKVRRFPDSTRRQSFHLEALNGPHSHLIKNGTTNKEELMAALRAMIEKTGNRIIE
ncbi:MAG: hypothetical protein WC651_00375 [Candidatus Gracilibacteria bacterium]|jgi:hypothetical protein